MVVLASTGFLGAYLSVLARNGKISTLWILACTAVSTAVWLFQVKGTMKLALASVLFDVVYGFSYFLGFVVMGEAATWKQITGMILALIGLLLVGA